MWSETDITPISLPGVNDVEIEVCNRIIYNEIGPLDEPKDREAAIALIHALINLSEFLGTSIAKMVTGKSIPKESDYGHKYRLLPNGHMAIVSTLEPSTEDNSVLINEIFSGHLKDPLYGDWMFFNSLEEEYPEYYRNIWGVGEQSGIKTGIIYGKFEFSPIAFLKARAIGSAYMEHLKHWEKQKKNMI